MNFLTGHNLHVHGRMVDVGAWVHGAMVHE